MGVSIRWYRKTPKNFWPTHKTAWVPSQVSAVDAVGGAEIGMEGWMVISTLYGAELLGSDTQNPNKDSLVHSFSQQLIRKLEFTPGFSRWKRFHVGKVHYNVWTLGTKVRPLSRNQNFRDFGELPSIIWAACGLDPRGKIHFCHLLQFLFACCSWRVRLFFLFCLSNLMPVSLSGRFSKEIFEL